MENFKFRLQKVLDVKKRKEDEHLLSHSKILNEKIKIENQIKELEIKYDNYSDLQYSETDAFKRQLAYNYKTHLYQSITRYREVLKEVERLFNESREKLIKLQSERKSIERLKEKQYNDFLKVQEELEDIQNDEFSIQYYYKMKLEENLEY